VRTYIAVVVLATLAGVTAARAQTVAETVVGDQSTLILSAIDGPSIGSLARTANVPMGFEATVPSVGKFSIKTAGRRLRDILDQMVAVDSRYEWREMEGVIVIRPSRAWSAPSPLNGPTGTVSLRNVVAAEALDAIARVIGQTASGHFISDSHTFSAEVPSGSTFLEALNTIVRAHGSLAWTLTPGATKNVPVTISLMSGSGGSGFGVRDGGVVTSESVVVRKTERVRGNDWTVDWGRIIPADSRGLPIAALSINSVLIDLLARAVHTPMGLEAIKSAPPTEAPDEDRSVTLTGKTLSEAVAVLGALDPRYQWRDMGGVIVFRPVTAWSAAGNPLSRRIGPIRLKDTVLSDAMKAFNSQLGSERSITFSDPHRFSLDSPVGSVLDALNAIVRSHGRLYWVWSDNDAINLKFDPTMLHRLTIGSTDGGGSSYPLP
jgi:hypothetical protein